MKTAKVPLTCNVTVDDLDPSPPESKVHLFRSMVGTLMYLAIWTRPDIAYAVNMLARHLTKASDQLIKKALHVFQYLKGTRFQGITFFKVDPLRETIPMTDIGSLRASLMKDKLYAFSDASDADDTLARRSTGGKKSHYSH